MNLQELKQLIDYAIDDCQWIILQNPKVVLSEGDFEKLLSECISKRIGYIPTKPTPDSFAVYTQISHYDNVTDKKDAEVDILLMKPDKIKRTIDKNKRFIYKSEESIAIELKYRHDDNQGCVTAAKEDIDKFVKYKDDSYYYSIILLDKNENTEEHEEEILKYYETQKSAIGRDYDNKFFCKVLVKETEHYGEIRNKN